VQQPRGIEFDRRWERSGASSENPGTTSYVKSATWDVDADTNFENVFAFPYNTVSDLPYSNPTLTSPQVQVETLVTNYESYFYPLKQIQDRLVQQISRASDYLYFENFGFSDPGLVKAVADRLQSAGPSLNVIVVTGKPATEGLMTRHAYTILSLDIVALVGSANFTKRSMVYDGELSVLISDPTQVAAMRTTLFAQLTGRATGVARSGMRVRPAVMFREGCAGRTVWAPGEGSFPTSRRTR
jgi:phosphatidylserine/phosphatidylglycerophosphate/cardiolipin synthase-like enzyme